MVFNILAVTAVCGALIPGIAAAQLTSAAPATNAVSAPSLSDLTEERARDLVLAHGFYGVGRLKLDSRGVWQGIAIQYGRSFSVEIDPRGNFTSTEK